LSLERLEDRTLLSPGDLDTSFGTLGTGKVTTDFIGSTPNSGQDIAVQTDGKIVVVGSAPGSTGGAFGLARYNADGSLDATFGTGGKVATSFSGFDSADASAVALQSNGQIVVAGYVGDNNITSEHFALARYNADGSLDTTFGSGGTITTAFSGYADAVALQADGKIVAAGLGESTGAGQDFALARFNANGSLDTSFGSGGEVTTDFSGHADDAYAVALQADGKIVAAGFASTPDGQSSNFALGRYNSDGSLDATFGSGGKVTTAFANVSNAANAVVLQADGKIVAAGFTSNGAGNDDFALARYTTSGSLDTSFGSGGKVTTDFAVSQDRANAVVLQADGKIVAAGFSSSRNPSDFALARYTASGLLDTSFGNKGKVTTDFAGFGDTADAVAVQADGKIVTAGDAYSNRTSDDFALARYTASGGLDTSFGSGGKVTTDSVGPTNNYAQGMAIQSDGKIVVAGFTTDYSSSYFSLARYNTDGSLDAGFGSGGEVTTDFGFHQYDRAHAVALQTDGKIVVVGTAYSSGTGNNFALARYNTNGSLDTSFGSGGEITTDFSKGDDQAFAVALQPDGKIVVAGYAYNNPKTNYDFALARYTASGSLDTTFGNNGKVTTSFGAYHDDVHAIALQSDGKIVAVGSASNINQPISDPALHDPGLIALARYTASGSLDKSFGSGGLVTTTIAGTDTDNAYAVAVQTDGKIVVAGNAGYDFALVRYTTSGSLDAGFGSGGKVTTDFANSVDRAYAVILQTDGQIVAAGLTTNVNSVADDFALARYTTGGSLDPTFGIGGKVTTDFGPIDGWAAAVALQTNGKIVAAGYADTSNGAPDFALARYIGGSTASPQALTGAVTAATGTTDPAVAIPVTPLDGTSFPSSAVLLAPTEALAPATASLVPGDDPGRMPVPQIGPTEVLDHALADLLADWPFGGMLGFGPRFVRRRTSD
jgi:uncharacterized delta-60 repeat protein